MALGARPARLLGQVLFQGVRPVFLGIVVGLPCSWGFSGLLQGQLFEIAPGDPATYVMGTLVILGTAVAAALPPALRAARVDPAIMLRDL